MTDSLVFTQSNSDLDIGVVQDASNYSVGGNPPRSAKANYLLWSKTDQNSVRTFTNPNQGSVLATTSYNVQTLSDGWYEGILMRFGIYDVNAAYVEQQESGGVVTQYASVFYYGTTDKVYKSIAPSIGQNPTDTNFFVEVTVVEFEPLIVNTNVDVYIKDFYIKARVNQCASAKFNKSCGCGCDGDLSEIRPALLIRTKIIAADNAFAGGSPEKMEEIIRDAVETCSNC